jgi:hypothetical protein
MDRPSKFAPKAIDPDELRDLVRAEATLENLAEHFGVCHSTIRRHLARHGLRTARAEGLRARRLAGRQDAPRATRRCPRHGDVEFEMDARGGYRCLRCRSEAVMRRRRKVKGILVAEAGGRCALCGYDRWPGALHFHHRDPSLKTFGVSQGGFTKSIERLRAEAAKCVLLCSNCHSEVEAGIVAVE